jgi:YbgC/YbaW family acyl-CoA thioester hydrolase
MFAYEVLIREFHLDTFGHMNNATYMSLFEEARWELITRGGFGLREIRERGLGPVVLEAQIKFLKEIRLRERIEITCEPQSYKGKVGGMIQKMIKEDGHTACEATFSFGLFDTHKRKLVDPTPEWLKAISWKP